MTRGFNIIIALIWSWLLIIVTSLSIPFDSSEVYVYENAFNPTACEMLHDLAVEHYERTNDGSSVFLRPPHNDRPLTPLEHAIDSALTEMGDKTKLVEYWSRDEYMNIDTHADLDESMLEQEARIRCPLVGHVLYMQVKADIRGPTCVFPEEKVGWGQQELDEDKKLVIVPAVEGRILRFPGSAMHAVPNPTQRWLMSMEEENALRTKEYRNDHEDEDEEDYMYDDEEIERSVLLFNTWPDEEPGPLGVNGDIATGALPDGIELSEEDAAAFLKSQEAQILTEWEEEYGKNGHEVRSNPFAEWVSVPINKDNETVGSLDEINVPLMGRESRRLYSKPSVRLQGPKEKIGAALTESSRVSAFHLSSS